MAVIGFLPLFGGPGYESALAAGLIVPIVVSLVTAFETAKAHPEPVDAFWKGVGNGLLFAAAAYLTTILHGFRAGFCDLPGGSTHFALGPGVGAVMGGVWGAVAGEIAGRRGPRGGRRLLAFLLALLGPLASFGVSAARFYTSPMVFAYDPFAGYFSGSFYDTVVDISGLAIYRVGSAATLVFVGLLAARYDRDPAGPLVRKANPRPAASVVLVAALVGSLASMAYGDRTSHWQTASSIKRTLGGSRSGSRCDVIFPRGMDADAVARFGRECDAHVEAGETWLGAPFPRRITAFLFADPAQKASLMGAANTYIAKPWRAEIYVHVAGYPHPTLGHEIMHVLAGQVARGPFKVAGTLGGWLPDPGLIEGIAVAGSPPEGDLTPREWAKAMKDLGILPPVDRLFSLGFFGHSSAPAYTVSGAFVAYVRTRFGPEAVRSWYGGRSLLEATGARLDEIEQGFRDDLDTITLPEAARVQAKARFDRPGLFGRRCPHVADACKERAEELKASGDMEGAIEQYKAALAFDPSDYAARIASVKAARRVEGDDAIKTQLEAIVDDEAAPRFARDRAIEEIGDLELAAGSGVSAVARYREVRDRIVSEDARRTLEVKVAAAGGAEIGRRAVVELLIGQPGRAPDKLRATELCATWAASEPDDGTPSYLLGRQAFNAGQLDEAAIKLDQAIARKIAVPRVRTEALRLRMLTACGLGDAKSARRLLPLYTAAPEVGAARREAAESAVLRCESAGGSPGGER